MEDDKIASRLEPHAISKHLDHFAIKGNRRVLVDRGVHFFLKILAIQETIKGKVILGMNIEFFLIVPIIHIISRPTENSREIARMKITNCFLPGFDC